MQDKKELVNKKSIPKSYTTTKEVINLKKELKAYKAKVIKLKKLIKFNKNLEPQMGKTDSQRKAIDATVQELEYMLKVYEDSVKLSAYEIQLSRQRTFESLCNYHPDKETAKKRLVKERDWS